MFRRAEKLIKVPCYFNKFDVDKFHFYNTSDASICKKCWYIVKSDMFSVAMKLFSEKKRAMWFWREVVDMRWKLS